MKRRQHRYAGSICDPWGERKRFWTLFSPSKPSPPPLPPLAKRDDVEIKRRKEGERLARLRRKGLDDTILTSGLGASGTAPVSKKTLLGGGLS